MHAAAPPLCWPLPAHMAVIGSKPASCSAAAGCCSWLLTGPGCSGVSFSRRPCATKVVGVTRQQQQQQRLLPQPAQAAWARCKHSQARRCTHRRRRGHARGVPCAQRAATAASREHHRNRHRAARRPLRRQDARLAHASGLQLHCARLLAQKRRRCSRWRRRCGDAGNAKQIRQLRRQCTAGSRENDAKNVIEARPRGS